MNATLSPGAVFGRYQLLRFLGEGGMGRVWAALDTERHELVALKFVKQPSDTGELERRLLREARAAMAVPHPHVRRILDVIEFECQPVLVLEFLAGETLEQRLAREARIPLRELAGLMLPVISAVGKAHECGIVHRDLKPANIFLPNEDGGVVKVLDFGIAKIRPLGEDQANHDSTANRALVGTPCYMSPEQMFGRDDIDHRSDIWSLGIILYQALSGELPTRGDNYGQTFKRIITPIQPLHTVIPDLPQDIGQLVMSMVAKERNARPSDLQEVEALLVRYAFPSFDSPPITRPRARSPRPVIIAPAASTTTLEEEPDVHTMHSSRGARNVQSWRRVAVGIGGAAVLMALGAQLSRIVLSIDAVDHAGNTVSLPSSFINPVTSMLPPVGTTGASSTPDTTPRATPPLTGSSSVPEINDSSRRHEPQLQASSAAAPRLPMTNSTKPLNSSPKLTDAVFDQWLDSNGGSKRK